RLTLTTPELGGPNWHGRPFSFVTSAAGKWTKEKARRCAYPFPTPVAARRKPISAIRARPACPGARPPAAAASPSPSPPERRLGDGLAPSPSPLAFSALFRGRTGAA